MKEGGVGERGEEEDESKGRRRRKEENLGGSALGLRGGVGEGKDEGGAVGLGHELDNLLGEGAGLTGDADDRRGAEGVDGLLEGGDGVVLVGELDLGGR